MKTLRESGGLRHPKGGAPAWVCLLLAFLFLYNPFLVLRSSSTFPNVQHPPSYRGTVASSELQSSRLTQPLPSVEVSEDAVLESFDAALTGAPPVPKAREKKPPQQQPLFFTSLWFRPPPAI
jgi:hypothetical protein